MIANGTAMNRLRELELTSAQENTSISLLNALSSKEDQLSWQRFVSTYQPMLHRWLRLRGLPEHLIPDVVGDVYVKLVGQMSSFVYDKRKSFRGWLRTMVENAATDILKRAHRRYENAVDFQSPAIASRCFQELDRLHQEPLEEFVDEIDNRLRLANAIVRRVKAKLSPNTWKAFYLTEIEGHACEDVALKLRMTSSSVYVARFRVKKQLASEAERLARD